MRVFFLNLSIFTSVLKLISSVFSKLLCFLKKERKNSQDQTSVPFTIKIQGQNQAKEIQLTDWSYWEDEENQLNEQGKKEGEGASEQEDDLFKDMTPVINKTKIVHVKRKVKSNQNISREPNILDQHMLKTKYEVRSELGTWEDDDLLHDSGWEDVTFTGKEVEEETESILKYNKLHEREKRAEEQKRKRVEKEFLRNKSGQQKLGVKIDLF